jgi:hypothetical protein
MQYFVDSAHITPQLGNEILDWVLLNKPMAENIGVRLSMKNIHDHLAFIRTQRENYVNHNPQVVMEISKTVESYVG